MLIGARVGLVGGFLCTVVGLTTCAGNAALPGGAVEGAVAAAVVGAGAAAVAVAAVVAGAVAAVVAGAVALVGASAAALAVLAGSPVVGATGLVRGSVGWSEDI